MIHKNYRRLCNLLVDIDEWGQVTVLNMLTRYARSQFMDPNRVIEDDKAGFYAEENKPTNTEEEEDPTEKRTFVMDSDHRLLLRCTKPLLQSRNSAVSLTLKFDLKSIRKRFSGRHGRRSTLLLRCTAK